MVLAPMPASQVRSPYRPCMHAWKRAALWAHQVLSVWHHQPLAAVGGPGRIITSAVLWEGARSSSATSMMTSRACPDSTTTAPPRVSDTHAALCDRNAACVSVQRPLRGMCLSTSGPLRGIRWAITPESSRFCRVGVYTRGQLTSREGCMGTRSICTRCI